MEASGAADMCDADDSATPDSTTRDRVLFNEGEDVLVRNKDGRFYLGTVVQLDMQSCCCLVKFLDNTELWSPFHELTRLSTPENDLLCVVCKSSQSPADNVVTACEKCSRGYHRLCHQPAIPLSASDGSWQCQKCRKPERKRKELGRRSGSLGRSAAASEPVTPVTVKSAESPLRPSSPVTSASTVPAGAARVVVPQCAYSSRTTPQSNDSFPERFPYDLNSLCWDLHHRSNEEDCYCYCGGPGLWFMQMLQCAHCRQWFHQNCVRCLHYPLYSGDRFYVFICSVCNKGCEFLRRFELKWVDVVHLALFNMTVFFAKKYFDLDGEILPYINGNAFSLQLPSQIVNCNLDTMRESILHELVSNENRFKCGKEIKKRTTIWGLRLRVPPTAHVLTLPKTRPMTDAALQEFWSDNPRLSYLPLASSRLSNSPNHPNGLLGVFDWAVMKGTAGSETQTGRFGRASAPGLRLLHVEVPGVALPASPGRICIKSSDNIGHAGYVNKCASHLAPNKLTLQQSLLRQKLHAMAIRPKRKHFFKRSKSLSLTETGAPADKKAQGSQERRWRAATQRRSYSGETSAQSAKKKSQDADEDEDSANESRQRGGGEGEGEGDDSQDETSQDDARKIPGSGIKLPPTPPSSVSAPGTPQPPSASPGDTSDSGGADSALPQSQSQAQTSSPPLSLTVAKLLGSPLCLPTESSTSASSEPLAARPSDAFHSIAIPLPLTRLITQPPLRTVKRKLSEKDIRIDRNGDVKRRRLRRSRSGLRTVQLDSGERLETRLVGGKLLRSPMKTTTPPDLAPPAAMEPPPVASASASQPARIPTPPPPSPPTPPTVEVSLEAVKKSVSSYFGTMNRIASGEKFLIKGKRTTPCGRTQYLIEWKS